MCQSAYKIDTGDDVDTVADLKKFCRRIVWNDPKDEETVNDNSCLCHVNIPSTLVEAGYRVWANPLSLPEYVFDSEVTPV